MKIEGRYIFELPIDVVYEALRDEELIRQALPGNVFFRMTSPTHYEASMELDVPRFGGKYSGDLDVIDTRPPSYYRLKARGQGPDRNVLAEGIVELKSRGADETEVRYIGETDAFVGLNRLVQLAAPKIAAQLANRGLHHLEKVILHRQGSAAAAGGDDAPATE